MLLCVATTKRSGTTKSSYSSGAVSTLSGVPPHTFPSSDMTTCRDISSIRARHNK